MADIHAGAAAAVNTDASEGGDDGGDDGGNDGGDDGGDDDGDDGGDDGGGDGAAPRLARRALVLATLPPHDVHLAADCRRVCRCESLVGGP